MSNLKFAERKNTAVRLLNIRHNYDRETPSNNFSISFIFFRGFLAFPEIQEGFFGPQSSSELA